MRSLLTKIFILIVLGCFIPSATETDIANCHQTFFDDYDTYIASPQLDLEVPGSSTVSSMDWLSAIWSGSRLPLFLFSSLSLQLLRESFQAFIPSETKNIPG